MIPVQRAPQRIITVLPDYAIKKSLRTYKAEIILLQATQKLDELNRILQPLHDAERELQKAKHMLDLDTRAAVTLNTEALPCLKEDFAEAIAEYNTQNINLVQEKKAFAQAQEQHTLAKAEYEAALRGEPFVRSRQQSPIPPASPNIPQASPVTPPSISIVESPPHSPTPPASPNSLPASPIAAPSILLVESPQPQSHHTPPTPIVANKPDKNRFVDTRTQLEKADYDQKQQEFHAIQSNVDAFREAIAELRRAGEDRNNSIRLKQAQQTHAAFGHITLCSQIQKLNEAKTALKTAREAFATALANAEQEYTSAYGN